MQHRLRDVRTLSVAERIARFNGRAETNMNTLKRTPDCTGVYLILAVALLAGCAAPRPQQVAPAIAPAPSPGVAPLVLPAILPRVMIIIDEQSLGTIATAEVEAMAIRKLMELNVPTIDHDMVRANIARSRQILEMAGDNRGAAALGSQFGADLVLVGEAVAKPSARRIADTNLRSYQAVATLRAVRTDNAATVSAVSEDATQVGLEDVSGSARALRAAATAALDRIVPEMLLRWTPSEIEKSTADFGHKIDLTFGGVDQVWKLRALRENLRAREQDVRNVVQRNYTSGIAEFNLESRLPSEELAEDLVLSPPEGLRLQVLEISPGRIQIRVVERQSDGGA